MDEGRFIVIEGIDGAGTTTLAARLAERLREARVPVHATAEPSGGPIGALIRQALTHRFVVPTELGARAPGWSTMALLFAADRLDHLEVEILPRLRDGITVVCDRYDLSSLAYQSASAGGEAARVVPFIREANRWARRPDLTLVVDVPAEVAEARRRSRSRGAELYEDPDMQRRLADAYRDAERLVPGDRVVHLDGTRTPDEVLGLALAALEATAGR
jgi:dTMP kinase